MLLSRTKQYYIRSILANILIALGILLLVAGGILKATGKKDTVGPLGVMESDTTSVMSPEENGHAFEEWVVNMFNHDAFIFKDWKSDKITKDGNFPENNQNPDLYFHLRRGGKFYPFAVECKYRSSFMNNEVTLAYPEQVDRYRAFSREHRVPVFVVLGMGGKASLPDSVYSIPLKKMGDGTFTRKQLDRFRTSNSGSYFFYDPDEGTLTL